MNKGILTVSAVAFSAVVVGNVFAQAPNFQPKANTNQDVVQTQIQTLNRELNELKKLLADQNRKIDALQKSDTQSSATIADLQKKLAGASLALGGANETLKKVNADIASLKTQADSAKNDLAAYKKAFNEQTHSVPVRFGAGHPFGIARTSVFYTDSGIHTPSLRYKGDGNAPAADLSIVWLRDGLSPLQSDKTNQSIK